MLVFGHLLAASMALGAIVATDLRMLAKLAQDRVRIAPPNEFVARLVTVALLLLYVTGAGILWIGSREHPDYLLNPKLQGKLILVLLLTINAFVLHRITFPRLARGRRVARWRLVDWVVVVMPVSLSNCLWMFCAFLGIARPSNNPIPIRDVLEIAATLYVLALLSVGLILAVAARQSRGGRSGVLISLLKKSLASVGSLGKDSSLPHDAANHRPRSTLPPPARNMVPVSGRGSASRVRRRADAAATTAEAPARALRRA